MLIPARNEASQIRETLEALKLQGSGFKVILIDDCSSDGTADIAREVDGIDLEIIQRKAAACRLEGKTLGAGAGVLGGSITPFVLLLDADIMADAWSC